MDPRRSVLFMPGTNTRAMDKARQLHADCIVFDLEDAVDSSDAAMARHNIGHALTEGGYAPRECLVRINHPTSDFFSDDMSAFAQWNANGVVIPKVDSVDQIDEVRRHLPSPHLSVWAMIETPKGVRDVDVICQSLNSGDGLIMGTQDLAKAIGLPAGSPDAGLGYALSKCVIAARAQNVTAIDGVYPKFNDLDGFALRCASGRQLGFDGKSLIHPGQIDLCNVHFSPTDQEVSEARELVDFWQKAGGGTAGVKAREGKMIEALHVQDACRLIEYHESLLSRFGPRVPTP